ncbi:Pr6Pr family membrane protein [Polaromonas sp. SM01]|uniref:Pr6Pr family membrane protein n=1 Tax=Polaromonas sp. SM01 TaxID=3085630 RepID=UPI0029825AFD|nr:Pr6Pr family membrane protein [Polaromonas sp. SM01]MDW5444672.1 Pr6Pr family membrane protein [Polaromonas sp. SM01]
MPSQHKLLSVTIWLLGVLTLVAIATQLTIHLRLNFSLVNFFSYFTNLANLMATLVLVGTASLRLVSRELSPALESARAISAVNMAVVGIVFSVLLRDVDLGSLLPWVNVLLHYVMPVAVVLEWLLRPPRTRFTARQVGLCLVIPLAYLTYVLVRGAAVAWYPYPFLNPAHVDGYGAVALYRVGIALVFWLTAWLLLMVFRRWQASD